MGWTDSHLHRFVIHGKDYGIAQRGGIWFTDDPNKVKLADLGWRVKERFLYQYDFGDNWQHQIRVEAILTSESTASKPVCISGKRACPPEDCGGAWNFMSQRQHYSIWYITDRFKEIVEQGEISDSTEEIHQLQRWLLVNHFDRKEVNSRLKQYAAGERTSTLFEQRIG